MANPTSEKQASYIRSLLDGKQVTDGQRRTAELVIAQGTSVQASAVIDVLRGLPWKPREAKVQRQVAADLVEGGVYESGSKVYRVQRSRQTGNLYALVLDPETGDFEYDRQAVFAIQQGAPKITFDRAVELGLRFNRCIHCSAKLRAKDSVLLAIGPVCAENHHGVPQRELVARLRAAQAERELATV